MKQIIILCLLLPLVIAAQTQVGQDIFPMVPSEESGWYVSSSADGQTVAVGAQPTGANNITYSSARVYTYDGSSWIQKGQTLELNNNNATSWFTRCRVSLSGDGNILAISTPFFGESSFGGIARIYQFNGTQWQQLGQDIVGQGEDLLGWSISISGSGNIVGILSSGTNNPLIDNLGFVTAYQYDGFNWQQMGQTIAGYTINIPQYEYFSLMQATISLSDDGSIMAIAAPSSYTQSDLYFGEVHLYEFTESLWQELGQTIVGDVANTNFAWDVDLTADGNTVVIGGISGNELGYVKTLELIGNQWVQKGGNIIAEEAADFFGHSVSISDNGNIIAIGAPQSTFQRGNVRIFHYNGFDWSQVGTTIWGDSNYDMFGYGVSLSAMGDFVAVGAPFHDTFPDYPESGQVSVYSLSEILSIEDYLENDFFLYPNPANNYLNIVLGNSVLNEVNFYNATGQFIKRSNDTTINVSDLPSGIYYVEIVSDKKKKTGNFIKR